MKKANYTFKYYDPEREIDVEIGVVTDTHSDIIDYLNRFLVATGHDNLKVVVKDRVVSLNAQDTLHIMDTNNITFTTLGDTFTLNS